MKQIPKINELNQEYKSKIQKLNDVYNEFKNNDTGE